ncbi:hypothetical protein AMQ83_28550, partial [Paenibacillus riograndensis]
MEQPPLEVFGTWQHAYEEDANGIAVYRPAGNLFASFQDREEIEIRQDGTFSIVVPRRSEAPAIMNGEWEQRKAQLMPVSYPHLRDHETPEHVVSRHLLDNK